MALTRVQVEQHLIGPDKLSGERGRLCAKAGLYDPAVSPPTVGTLPALGGPVAGALRSLGVEPADPVNPTDADLAKLPDGTAGALLALADLFLLKRCLGNWDKPNAAISFGRQDWGDFRKTLQTEYDAQLKLCRDLYGYGLSSPSAGSTDLGFAASSPWCGYVP